MYDSAPQTFEQVIAPYPDGIREIAGWVRELIRSEFSAPEAP